MLEKNIVDDGFSAV